MVLSFDFSIIMTSPFSHFTERACSRPLRAWPSQVQAFCWGGLEEGVVWRQAGATASGGAEETLTGGRHGPVEVGGEDVLVYFLLDELDNITVLNGGLDAGGGGLLCGGRGGGGEGDLEPSSLVHAVMGPSQPVGLDAVQLEPLGQGQTRV
jgi:hypothetical protein